MLAQDARSEQRRRLRLRRLRLARLLALGCVVALALPLLFRHLPSDGESAWSTMLWLLDLDARAHQIEQVRARHFRDPEALVLLKLDEAFGL